MDAEALIREARTGDLAEMALLLAELFTIEDDFVIDEAKQINGLRLLLESSSGTVFVAQLDQRVVGMLTVQSVVSTAAGEYVGLIEDLIVSEPYRGCGIGKQLLHAVLAASKEKGLGRLALAADNRNVSAIAFYQKYGFETSRMGMLYRYP